MRLLPFFLFFSAAAVSSPTAPPPPPALPPSTAFHLTDSLWNNKNNNLVPLCLCHWHCPRPYSSLNYLFSGPYFMLILLLLLWVLRFSLLLWKTVGGGYSSWSHSSSPWPSSSSSSSSSSSVARGRFVKRNSLSSFFSYFRFLSLLAAYLHCCCVAEKVARLLSAISSLAYCNFMLEQVDRYL